LAPLRRPALTRRRLDLVGDDGRAARAADRERHQLPRRDADRGRDRRGQAGGEQVVADPSARSDLGGAAGGTVLAGQERGQVAVAVVGTALGPGGQPAEADELVAGGQVRTPGAPGGGAADVLPAPLGEEPVVA